MYTVKTIYHNFIFGETISMFAAMNGDDPVNGMGNCSNYRQAQTYADQRNNGIDHESAIDYVLDNIRIN